LLTKNEVQQFNIHLISGGLVARNKGVRFVSRSTEKTLSKSLERQMDT
jgi:hypothetical protein